jgi:ABC exporter DevB family membrane fusion protein
VKYDPKQSASILLGAAVVVTATAWFAGGEPSTGPSTNRVFASEGPANAETSKGTGRTVAAGLGVVEPASGTIDLSALMPGVVESISKQEGDKISKGETLAQLSNDDLKAIVDQSEANVRLEAARLALLENGSRPEEIAQAQAKVVEAQSNVKLLETQLKRHVPLAREGAISVATLNETQQSLTASQQQLTTAKKQLDIVRLGARPEEIEEARASLKLAKDKLAEARAKLEKTYLRAPLDGIVLRRYLEPGEAVSNQTVSPILQVADTSRMVVRTQIDENDIGGLAVGQKAEISAPYLQGRPLTGTVIRISPRLGAKTVTAETPNEKRDTRVLDVIVALDPGVSVPVNLRVDVAIDLKSTPVPLALRGTFDPPIQVTIAPTALRLLEGDRIELANIDRLQLH